MDMTWKNESTQTVPIDINETQETGVVSKDIRVILELALWFTMLPLNIMGIITNIVNIRVFFEQGVRNDSTNIGFVCLSISDLFACITLIPYPICFILKYTDGIAYHHSCTSFSKFFVHVHIASQNTSTWTTVYISLIRSLCVVFPLKVKMMFTPKVTTVVITSIIFIFLAIQLLYTSVTTLVWVFDEELNTTVAFVIEEPSAQTILYYHQLITNQISPVLAVIIVTISSILMTQKLIQVKKWRSKNSSGSCVDSKEDAPSTNKKPMASKDIELIKFILTTASIFLVCNLIGITQSIPIMVFPDVSFNGVNQNLFYLVFFIRFWFDSINASINFFFYIRVSSRYKNAFASSFKDCSSQLLGADGMTKAT